MKYIMHILIIVLSHSTLPLLGMNKSLLSFFNPIQKDIFGNPPLCQALLDNSQDSLDKIRHLLEHGANPNDLYTVGDQNSCLTPLQTALFLNSSEKLAHNKIKLLLQYGARFTTACNNNSTTILHTACSLRSEKIIPTLIKNISPLEIYKYINAQDKNGMTALMIACEKGLAATVEILLKNGARVSKTNHLGQNAFFFAQDKKTIDLLVKQSTPKELNWQDNNGNTPLHNAIKKQTRCIPTALYLINNQATLTIKNKSGQTPLHIACENSDGFGKGDAFSIELLIDNGITLDNAADNNGSRPFTTQTPHVLNPVPHNNRLFAHGIALTGSSATKEPCEKLLYNLNYASQELQLALLMRTISLDYENTLINDENHQFWQALNNRKLSTEESISLIIHAIRKNKNDLALKLVNKYSSIKENYKESVTYQLKPLYIQQKVNNFFTIKVQYALYKQLQNKHQTDCFIQFTA